MGMTREQAIDFAIRCVMASSTNAKTKIKVIKVLIGIEMELDEKLEGEE